MEAAMQMVADRYQFLVRWEPFLLRPDMPPEGIPKQAVTPENPRVGPRMKKAGEQVGIDFTGKCDRYPNTLQAHALMEYAKEYDGGSKQNDLAEVLFQAYFTDGICPDTKNLVSLAQRVGLDAEEVQKVVINQERLQTARKNARYWSEEKGVSGVPDFYMNGQHMFSGAQDPQSFLKAFEITAANFQ